MLGQCAMLTRAMLLGLLLGSGIVSAAMSPADETNLLMRCPGYRTALEEARGALDRGARAEAVVALKKAKVALERCSREEAGRTNHVASVLVETTLES